MEEEARSKKRPSTSHLEVTPVSKRHKPLSDANTPTPHKNTLFAYGFKRLAEPRPLLGHSMSLEEPVTPPTRPKFRHCLSESEADIKRALHRCELHTIYVWYISNLRFYMVRICCNKRLDFVLMCFWREAAAMVSNKSFAITGIWTSIVRVGTKRVLKNEWIKN